MSKLIGKSVLIGIVLFIISIIIVLLIPNKTLSKIILFPGSAIVSFLMGERTPIGYTKQGEPMVEGTPIDGILILFGLLFQLFFFSLISFLVLSTIKNRRTE